VNHNDCRIDIQHYNVKYLNKIAFKKKMDKIYAYSSPKYKYPLVVQNRAHDWIVISVI
jgi:hypothetical protein